jgi:hypothetical protein
MNRCFAAGAFLALAAGALAAPDTARPGEIDALLQQIKKVGREGSGNVAAGKAWKALVAHGTPALVSILSAMNDDDLTSPNWLRPAFEAIAERTLADGKPLPKSALQKFVAQTRNPARARRLAYEWLVKIDKNTPDRFLPTMLRDPSPELRRDAVARVIDQAQVLMEKKDDKSARQVFQYALTGACDRDQVDTIAAALGKLGVKVDLQTHFGVVSTWHVIAPFEHTKNSGWNVAYPPERGVDLRKTYKGKDGKEARWVTLHTKEPYGYVDLNKELGKMKGTIAYAWAVFDSPKERLVELRAGSANALKIFLNGKLIFQREEYHHAMDFDQYAARGTLKAGRNEILFKVCQNEQTENWAQVWAFQLRVCDPVGAGVPFTEVDIKEKR